MTYSLINDRAFPPPRTCQDEGALETTVRTGSLCAAHHDQRGVVERRLIADKLRHGFVAARLALPAAVAGWLPLVSPV